MGNLPALPPQLKSLTRTPEGRDALRALLRWDAVYQERVGTAEVAAPARPPKLLDRFRPHPEESGGRPSDAALKRLLDALLEPGQRANRRHIRNAVIEYATTAGLVGWWSKSPDGSPIQGVLAGAGLASVLAGVLSVASIQHVPPASELLRGGMQSPLRWAIQSCVDEADAEDAARSALKTAMRTTDPVSDDRLLELFVLIEGRVEVVEAHLEAQEQNQQREI